MAKTFDERCLVVVDILEEVGGCDHCCFSEERLKSCYRDDRDSRSRYPEREIGLGCLAPNIYK